MNPNIYNIDFNKLITWLLPSRLRQSKMIAFLKIAASPFVLVYQSFLRYRKEKLYELMITPQVCYLETLLRDRYDSIQRRIFISDGIEQPALYLFQDSENHEIPLYTDGEDSPQLLFTDGESEGNTSDDFVINVPSDIVFSEIEMRSLVMRFRLPGMKFKIQTF